MIQLVAALALLQATSPAPTPFLSGADISFVDQEESEGRKYSDGKGPEDIFAILKRHGFNAIRLRLFVDPAGPKGYSPEKGFCDLPHTLKMAKRVKAAGMNFMLDLHYSDTWADPGHQYLPSAWEGLDENGLRAKIRSYTKDVIAAFDKQSTLPDEVQIGNEISAGFLWPIGTYEHPDAIAHLFSAGAGGVRDASAKPKIILHLALGGQFLQSKNFIDSFIRNGASFDILGQSYYPQWQGTTNELRETLTRLANLYKKPIMVVEYTTPTEGDVYPIVKSLPNGLGQGAFIWEPTRGLLFDRAGAARPELSAYDELNNVQ